MPTPDFKKDSQCRFIPAPAIAWNSLEVHDQHVPLLDFGSGVKLYDMRDFMIQHPEIAAHYCIAKDAGSSWNKQKLSAFVQACWSRAFVLYVPPGVSLERPIDLSLVGQYAASLLIEKIVLIVDEGAEATVHDQLNSSYTQAGVVVRSIDCWLRAGARLHMIHDQDLQPDVSALCQTNFYLDKQSELVYHTLLTGGSFAQSLIDIILHGKHAQATVRGAYILNNEQRVSITSHQRHMVPGTQSDVNIKGALQDNARSMYQGTIFIKKKAANTCAEQQNKNILLSSSARAYSIPILEILNNDVQCMHGSAIGQLDNEQLFYLQARAIPEPQARRLLIEGFFAHLFDAIRNTAIASLLHTRIATKLFR